MSDAVGTLTPHQAKARAAISKVLALQIAQCSSHMADAGLPTLEALAVVTEVMLQAGVSSGYELAILEGRSPDKERFLRLMSELFDQVAKANLAVSGVLGNG